MRKVAGQSEQRHHAGRAGIAPIPHSRPTISEGDIRAVTEVLASGRLADTAQVTLFERELSSYVGHAGGVAANSGTSALYLALLSLGRNGRNEVIIPSYTCIALLNAIYAAQLTPVVVDIEEHGFNISFSTIQRAMTHRTRAIVAPHMFGDPISDIQAIVALGVPVIEDCALSVGARVDGTPVGSIAELAVFSFYATKLLTTGQGGMVLSSSDTRLNALKDLMQYDHRLDYRRSVNLRLTDVQAALGRSQLARLDDFIARRRYIARRYDRRLMDTDRVRVPVRAYGSVYFRYILQVEDADAWIARVGSRGVDCRRPVFKPLHEYLNLSKQDYPNTERAHRHNVSVPIYPGLKDSEIEFIVDRIASC